MLSKDLSTPFPPPAQLAPTTCVGNARSSSCRILLRCGMCGLGILGLYNTKGLYNNTEELDDDDDDDDDDS